jgi:predicted nucleotidyltransferase
MPAKPPTPLPPLSRGFRSMMPKDLKELLRAFNDHAVKYLVVGGYAFGVHAEPRATKDLDLFIRSDKENSEAVFRALAQYGAPLAGLSPSDFMDDTGFQIGQPPARIDLLQHIDGISFDEAWENRIEGLLDGEIRTLVISRDDLIRNKLASGREQDVLDVKKLRAAAQEGA